MGRKETASELASVRRAEQWLGVYRNTNFVKCQHTLPPILDCTAVYSSLELGRKKKPFSVCHTGALSVLILRIERLHASPVLLLNHLLGSFGSWCAGKRGW